MGDIFSTKKPPLSLLKGLSAELTTLVPQAKSPSAMVSNTGNSKICIILFFISLTLTFSHSPCVFLYKKISALLLIAIMHFVWHYNFLINGKIFGI